MKESLLQQHIVSIARALGGEQRRQAVAAGVPAVQWQILAYLHVANRYSDTPQAIADYLCLTKGTVSQSLQRLVAAKLIVRSGDAEDRRIGHYALSAAGRRLVGRHQGDGGWTAALERLPAAEHDAAACILSSLLKNWQESRNGRTFGVCRTCRHFGREADACRCALTGEPLSEEDAKLICREHLVR